MPDRPVDLYQSQEDRIVQRVVDEVYKLIITMCPKGGVHESMKHIHPAFTTVYCLKCGCIMYEQEAEIRREEDVEVR